MSQIHDAALEMFEHNVLYRGYLNRIHAVVSNTEGKEVVLTSKELQISKDDSTTFTVKPIERNKSATINISLTSNGDTSFVRSVNYRIMNLPTPILYWGPNKDGTHASIKEKKLFVKYPPEITLNAVFSILTWEISIDSSFNALPIMGRGSNISEANSLLKKVNHSSIVSVVITYVGPDEIRRKLSACWKVDSWEDTEEPKELLIID